MTDHTASQQSGDIQTVWGDDVAKFYNQRGFSNRVGFGKRPAVLIVDMANAFTDPSFQLGVDMTETVHSIQILLKCARETDVPVIYATTMFDDPPADMGTAFLKVPALAELKRGTRAVEIDARLPPQPGDLVVVKRYWSSFMMTNLITLLTGLAVDTLVIAGCSTSGCIRAAATDALCYGLHPIVPREAVADRWKQPHNANLFDIDSKFADVVDLSNVLEYFRTRTFQ